MMKIVLAEPSIEPDWQPQGAAATYPEGHLQFSSVGQLWQVKGRQWQRVHEPTQEQLIGLLAERFLAWPVPESVCSDLCATTQQPGRSGTNLLTATEARQMIAYLFGPDKAA